MYGIVNKAIEELIITNYGEDTWKTIHAKSGIDYDFFISDKAYDDEITFTLAKTISEELSIPINEVLLSLGEWWIVKTTREKYGSLMESGGSTLKEFLVNLPIFHNRVMLIYPKLTPPEFKVTDITERSLNLHYISKREGLQEFVRGLIQGLSIIFTTDTTIELIQSREENAEFEIFKISW